MSGGDGRAARRTTGCSSPAGRSARACRVATGAAVACPDRPVLSLEADGSAMYTIQALWTQARESLDVTTVIMNNRSYAILNIELARTGAGAGGPEGPRPARPLPPRPRLRRSSPRAWACPPSPCARPTRRVAALSGPLAEPGPHLIEALLEPR